MTDLAEREAKRRNRALDLLPVVERMCLDGDEKFPSVVETLWRMFNDDTLLESPKGDRPLVDSSVKAKIGFKLLELSALAKEVEVAKGLGKVAKKQEVHNHLTLVFNKSEEEIRAMDPASRELYLTLGRAAAAQIGPARD